MGRVGEGGKEGWRGREGEREGKQGKRESVREKERERSPAVRGGNMNLNSS